VDNAVKYGPASNNPVLRRLRRRELLIEVADRAPAYPRRTVAFSSATTAARDSQERSGSGLPNAEAIVRGTYWHASSEPPGRGGPACYCASR